MRMMFSIMVGIIGGFILGIALSSFIGVISLYTFGKPMGIKFLPYICSFVCAFAVPVLDWKSQNKG